MERAYVTGQVERWLLVGVVNTRSWQTLSYVECRSAQGTPPDPDVIACSGSADPIYGHRFPERVIGVLDMARVTYATWHQWPDRCDQRQGPRAAQRCPSAAGRNGLCILLSRRAGAPSDPVRGAQAGHQALPGRDRNERPRSRWECATSPMRWRAAGRSGCYHAYATDCLARAAVRADADGGTTPHRGLHRADRQRSHPLPYLNATRFAVWCEAHAPRASDHRRRCLLASSSVRPMWGYCFRMPLRRWSS